MTPATVHIMAVCKQHRCKRCIAWVKQEERQRLLAQITKN